MIITDEGKQIFLEAIERTGKPVVSLFLSDTEEGVGLNIGLIEEAGARRLIEVNGIKIDITEEDEAALEETTFDAEGENLKVTMPHCGCGHHRHHHGEGCCHHHEGEECCCDDGCDCHKHEA